MNRLRTYYQSRFNHQLSDAVAALLRECRLLAKGPNISIGGLERAALGVEQIVREWRDFQPSFPDFADEVSELIVQVMRWAMALAGCGSRDEATCDLVRAAVVCGERC